MPEHSTGRTPHSVPAHMVVPFTVSNLQDQNSTKYFSVNQCYEQKC